MMRSMRIKSVSIGNALARCGKTQFAYLKNKRHRSASCGNNNVFLWRTWVVALSRPYVDSLMKKLRIIAQQGNCISQKNSPPLIVGKPIRELRNLCTKKTTAQNFFMKNALDLWLGSLKKSPTCAEFLPEYPCGGTVDLSRTISQSRQPSSQTSRPPLTPILTLTQFCSYCTGF